MLQDGDPQGRGSAPGARERGAGFLTSPRGGGGV